MCLNPKSSTNKIFCPNRSRNDCNMIGIYKWGMLWILKCIQLLPSPRSYYNTRTKLSQWHTAHHRPAWLWPAIAKGRHSHNAIATMPEGVRTVCWRTLILTLTLTVTLTMVAAGYVGPGWLWDCGYGGPWLWRAVTDQPTITLHCNT